MAYRSKAVILVIFSPFLIFIGELVAANSFSRHFLPWEADIVIDHHSGEGGRIRAFAAQHALLAQILFEAVEDERDG